MSKYLKIDSDDSESTINDDQISVVDDIPTGQSSVLGVTLNLVNTIVGSGIIGLPFALREAGFGLGIIITLFVAYMANVSTILMVRAGVLSNRQSYGGLAQSAFGPFGFWLLNGIIVVNGVGTMVSYLIIICNSFKILGMQYIPDVTIFTQRWFVLLVPSFGVILPLLFFRDIGRLARVSFFGVLSIPIVISLVIYRAFSGGVPDHEPTQYPFFGHHPFGAIGVVAFSFVSNQVSFLNYASLKQKTIRNWTQASSVATSFALIVSLSLALVGYVAFGDSVRDNILDSFPDEDNFINFARLVLALAMLITYPMAFYPTRDALMRMLGLKSIDCSPTTIQHVCGTVVLFGITVGIALAVSNLGIVYELVGGVCSTMIAYIIPGAICLCVYRYAYVASTDEERYLLLQEQEKRPGFNFLEALFSGVLVVFGIFVLVTATGSTILSKIVLS